MILLLNGITSLVAFLLCIFLQNRICNEYSMICVLPIIYMFLSSILIQLLRQKKDSVYRTTATLFLLLQWLRCVINPIVGVMSEYYKEVGGRIDSSSASIAMSLIIYEAIISFAIVIITIRYSRKENGAVLGEEMSLSGDSKIYAMFVLLAFGLMLFTRNVPFQFLALETGTSSRRALLGSSNQVLDTIILYGLTFLLIIIISWMHKKYLVSNRELFINVAIIAVVLRLSVISSESRLALIYQVGTGLMLLTKLFPEKRKKVFRIIIWAAVVVVGLLTIYKVFYAFLYDSYIDAILSSRQGFGANSISAQIDAYFYGIKTIARNITYVKGSNEGHFLTWIMDILRNTFGIHYAFRSNAVTTIESYNLFIYGGNSSSGYLFSSIAYGYMYYGFLLAPLSTIINFWLSCFMEKRIRSIKYIEIYYIMCLAYVRFAVSQFAVFSATWNYVSRTILIGMVVIGFASIGRIGSSKKIVIGYRQYNR